MGRKPIGKIAMTHAERTRKYREKHGLDKPAAKPAPASTAPLEARIRELEAELAAAKARIDELRAERLAFRFGSKRRGEAKPKAEKPPLPPDEERERTIKALRTEVRNLKAERRHLTEHFNSKIADKGGMNFPTMTAIAKCLHPDHAPSEAEREAAFKLFSQWKADDGKAQRRARSKPE